ncbi:MAG TPA: hypothetical protein VGC21_10695 [Telluria sp.]
MQATKQIQATLLAILIGTAGITLLPSAAYAQNVNAQMQNALKRQTADALAAAQRDFAQFSTAQQQLRGSGAPTDFPLDITDLQDLKQAVVSYGFPVHTVDPNEMLAGRSSMQGLAKQTSQWRFVITLHERPIGMATVERNNGRYETVEYGASVLSKDVDAMAGFHGNADKSNLRFVRVYQARSDFLEVKGQDGRARFAPLHSARESLMLKQRAAKSGNADDGLLDEAEFIQPLRSAIKLNMAAPL